MHLHEKHHRQAVDHNRLLERHRHGMIETSRKINSLYRGAQMAETALQHKAEGRHSHHSLGKSRRRFAEAADRYAHEINPHENPDEYMYATVMSVVPRMIDAHRTLNHRHASREQRHTAKLQMIEFNDALRSIIDINPAIDEDVVKSIVRSSMLSYGYGAEDINDGIRETKYVLVGMKHELAFESALAWLPDGYEILETTDEDDKHGADFKVQCPNGVVLYIDVKSTPESALAGTEANINFYSRFHEQVPKNQLVLYSGFTREDFDPSNPWRPNDKAVQRVYPELEKILHKASVDTEQQMKLARMGKIVVGRHA